MAELNKIRFLLFAFLMIFPAHALDVILSGALDGFKQKSEIIVDIMDGVKIYRGTFNQLTYEAKRGISKVIVYIISRSRCIEILRPAGVALATRSQIAKELYEMDCELVFLGIENFDDDEYHLISAFLPDTIRRHPEQTDFHFETIGENRFDHFYHHTILGHVVHFGKYQEHDHIYERTFLARLRSIPHGAHKPIARNNKEIKLWGYYPTVGEVTWSVHVENGTYVPNVELDDPKYNFMIKFPNKNICLLIISGKEYSSVTRYGKRCAQRATMKEFIHDMKQNDEVLIMMGAFNFDWTEVDIVTQIILRHSEGSQSLEYNVFTCGYGMFNTYHLNVYEGDKRNIRQQSNSPVSKVVQLLMGEEVKQRAMNVYYYDDEWRTWDTIINLFNGRYFPELRYINSALLCLHPKIAFIVYDGLEMNGSIDYSVVVQSVGELERSGISVVFIEAINFGLDDAHIIAEWIDYHCGIINLEQIAVLGGGIFDTIFQSESNTYNTFLDTKKIELETIRNAYVRNGNGKSVSVARIDYSNVAVCSFPMTTLVNGFYEPDLIPDKSMFNTTDGRKIYFIITSAYNFQRILAINHLVSVASSFRKNIMKLYPNSKWTVFLVGLENFVERDSHLFAELVKRQTSDGRCFREFVRTFNYGISPVIYQYKDADPFDFDTPLAPMHARFTSIFGWTCQLS